MNLIKYQIIVLIEKYKKVTDVAAELGLKQPTVTFHMKNLEAEMGIPLFLYRSGRVLLTEAGQSLYGYALKIVGLAEEAERAIRQYASTASGCLELEAEFVPGTYFLPDIIASFMQLYPETKIRLSLKPNASLREKLRAHEASMTVLHQTEDREEPSLQYQTLGIDEPVLVYAPGHALDGLDTLTPERIVLEPWVHHAPGSCLRETADAWAEMNDLRLRNQAELDTPDLVKRLVMESGCVGICSRIAVEEERLLGKIRYAPLPGITPRSASFVLAWRKDQPLSPVQQAFAEMLNEAH